MMLKQDISPNREEINAGQANDLSSDRQVKTGVCMEMTKDINAKKDFSYGYDEEIDSYLLLKQSQEVPIKQQR
jgi:hypothetical protein